MCCQKFNAGENTLAATRKKHHYRNKEVVDLQATKKVRKKYRPRDESTFLLVLKDSLASCYILYNPNYIRFL